MGDQAGLRPVQSSKISKSEAVSLYCIFALMDCNFAYFKCGIAILDWRYQSFQSKGAGYGHSIYQSVTTGRSA